jgi:hypothetical protein
VSKRFHALTNTIGLQAQTCQQELEFLWGRLQEELKKRDAEQHIKEKQHLERINRLEREVQKLQKALDAVKNQKPVTEALKTPQISNAYEDPRTEGLSTFRSTSEAAPEPLVVHSKGPAQHSRPDKTSYADIATLLATNPGGQGWQTVPGKKPRKAPKARTMQLEPKTEL